MPKLVYKNPNEMTSQETNTGRNIKQHRQTILLDFDGVLHNYTGWEGPEKLNSPIEKARAACFALEKKYRLVVFTTRPSEYVIPWLRKWSFPEMKVTNIKEPAFLIIDDRAITFNGNWSDELLKQIDDFKPYWEATKV